MKLANSSLPVVPQKIMLSYCLMPEGKKILGDFLDKNFEALKQGDPNTKQKLQKIIRETFPKESLEELQKILKGESEYALHITNCPERQGFEHAEKPEVKQSYSYYIGGALYEMNAARHLGGKFLWRHSHLFPKKSPPAGYIHRDFAKQDAFLDVEQQPVAADASSPAHYIIFSAPYNGEHAKTQIINVAQAILSIPPDLREKIRVNIQTFDESKERRNITLDKLLYFLKHPAPGQNMDEQALFPSQSQDPKLTQMFLDAVEKYSVKVDLQPGDLLALNENAVFHRAHNGVPEHIHVIPKSQKWSRVFMHNAGTPVTHR
jgi:hypothetical protein